MGWVLHRPRDALARIQLLVYSLPLCFLLSLPLSLTLYLWAPFSHGVQKLQRVIANCQTLFSASIRSALRSRTLSGVWLKCVCRIQCSRRSGNPRKPVFSVQDHSNCYQRVTDRKPTTEVVQTLIDGFIQVHRVANETLIDDRPLLLRNGDRILNMFVRTFLEEEWNTRDTRSTTVSYELWGWPFSIGLVVCSRLSRRSGTTVRAMCVVTRCAFISSGNLARGQLNTVLAEI